MSGHPSLGKRLVLLRHGRTAWNHAGRVQGQTDVSLDDEGRAQAARVAPAMAALAPAVAWCSDLARARETVAPVATAAGLEVTYDARLREFALGEREGLAHADYADVAPEEFARFVQGDFDVVPDGERTAAVAERMTAVLGDLLAAVEPGATALAVSHGAAIRVGTGALLGWPDDQFHTLRGLDNCASVVLTQHASGARLRLAAYNRVA